MSQPSAELERLRAELEKMKDLVIEAHHKFREDLRKAMDMLDAQKVKFAKSQVALEEARRSAADSQAASSNAEARLEEVLVDRKVIYESTIELREQVKS